MARCYLRCKCARCPPRGFGTPPREQCPHDGGRHPHDLSEYGRWETLCSGCEGRKVTLENPLVSIGACVPRLTRRLGDALEGYSNSPTPTVGPALSAPRFESAQGDDRNRGLRHPRSVADLLETGARTNGRDERLRPLVERHLLRMAGFGSALRQEGEVVQDHRLLDVVTHRPEPNADRKE